MAFRRRGGRKLIVAPDGTSVPTIAGGFLPNNVLVNALARAFRWQRLLDRGTYTTIKEIAAKEKIDPSYVGDVLRLNLLAPDIIEMILNGLQPPELQFERLRKSLPLEWEAQRSTIRADLYRAQDEAGNVPENPNRALSDSGPSSWLQCRSYRGPQLASNARARW
jgi:hypothetical protein